MSSTQSIKEAVEAGLGLTLLSKLSLAKERKLGTLKLLRADGLPFPRVFSVLVRRGDLRTRTLEAFLGALRETVAAL
jgi:DNA-binding transcriptional LysR family regulator